MDKNIPFVIIGFGSIGQRHAGNLRELGFLNLAVYDPNSETLKDWKGEILASLDEKSLSRFKIAFVTNPTYVHVPTALLAARAGCHLFVEKPLSHTEDGIAELAEVVSEKKLTAMVACNMRFHPAYAAMKEFIALGKLGRVFRVNLSFDYYLPRWRPGADYRKNYAAKKEWGGGILLDDIHEFDLLFWFADFDEVLESRILKSRSGTLEIETEDEAAGVFRFTRGIIGVVSSGYLSKRYKREAVIIGERGVLSFEWNDGVVFFEDEKGKREVFNGKGVDLNVMYERELSHFLTAVEEGEPPMNSIGEAHAVLHAVLRP